MSKFTKVRKWANKKGYEVKDIQRNGDQPGIYIIVNPKFRFELELRRSTIYQSVRGQKGSPKGLYLSAMGEKTLGFSFFQGSQQQAIEAMESDIKKWVTC